MDKVEIMEQGWNYIGNGLWQCNRCGYIVANRDLAEFEDIKCPKCKDMFKEEVITNNGGGTK